MHVIYVRDTVDDAIYGIEDWAESTGTARNFFYHFLPPDEPEQQLGPPRIPLPADDAVDEDSLIPGGLYPGRYEGLEYTADTTRTIRVPKAEMIEGPEGLWEEIVSLRGAPGRFRVTPRRHYVLIRRPANGDWETIFVRSLDGPLRAEPSVDPSRPARRPAVPQSLGEHYEGQLDGAEYRIRKSSAGFIVARRVKGGGRGYQSAVAGKARDQVVHSVESLSKQGIDITHFVVNDANHAIARYGGKWIFLAELEGGIEF
jgi:hypothetical protein